MVFPDLLLITGGEAPCLRSYYPPWLDSTAIAGRSPFPRPEQDSTGAYNIPCGEHGLTIYVSFSDQAFRQHGILGDVDVLRESSGNFPAPEVPRQFSESFPP